MRLHELKPKHKNKEKKRVGRGGKWRTYAGRGDKGQKSRAGARFQPIIRRLIKRYPKLRGYDFKPKEKPEIVNVGELDKKFDSGDEVTPEVLVEKDLVEKKKGRIPDVKILGKGELDKKLIIKDCDFSEGAKEKIEAENGSIE